MAHTSDYSPTAQPAGRTGADVIAPAMAQPDVCKCPMMGAGTTGKQADMTYGADPGYGM